MGTEQPIRVVLVDDHELFRQGLRGLLEDDGVEVVDEAADGETAVRKVAATAPDVVVMDVNLPAKSGIEATREIRRESPTSRVLMVSVYEEENRIAEAIVAGASGYLLKDSAAEEISAGVRATARGEPKLSSRIAARLLRRVEEGGPPGAGRPLLTDRETAVLRAIAAGKDNDEIASTLGTNAQTVRGHVANVLAKLEMTSRIEAAVHAMRRP